MLAGAVQLTTALALPAVAVTFVGAPGTLATGVTEFEGADCGPKPAELIAATVNVYAFPAVRPFTVCVVAVELKVIGAGAAVPAVVTW